MSIDEKARKLLAEWTGMLIELRTLITAAKLNVVTPLDDVRAFKNGGRQLVKTLRQKLQQLSVELNEAVESARFWTDTVELEFLLELCRAEPRSHEHDPRIVKLCDNLWDSCCCSDEVRPPILQSALGAALDSSVDRRRWLDRARPIVDAALESGSGYLGVAYNYTMATLMEGDRNRAIQAARLVDPSNPSALLLFASIYAHESDSRRCLYFTQAYFGEVHEEANQWSKRLRKWLAAYRRAGRALLLLTWGYQGVYALTWECSHATKPRYTPLLAWRDAEDLSFRCGRLPWGRFLNRQTMRDNVQLNFDPKDYELLQELWSRILEPIVGQLTEVTQGVDIVPVGWLGLLPWTACGPDPANEKVVGERVTVATIPQFSLLAEYPETQIADCAKRFHVRGDDNGIKLQCQAEEKALVELGFEVIESRQDILSALCTGHFVHFNGHGKNPHPKVGTQHFMLKDGSVFDLQEFMRLQGDGIAPVVTFSACELGFTYFGDGIYSGIPTSLLLKGTRACVASLGEVNAKVAATFFPTFYKELLLGRRVGEAAQRASVMRKGAAKGSKNLGLWAPLIVYGDQWVSVAPSAQETEDG